MKFGLRDGLLFSWIIVKKNVFFFFSQRKLIEQLLCDFFLLNKVLQADLVLLVLSLHISYRRKQTRSLLRYLIELLLKVVVP